MAKKCDIVHDVPLRRFQVLSIHNKVIISQWRQQYIRNKFLNLF